MDSCFRRNDKRRTLRLHPRHTPPKGTPSPQKMGLHYARLRFARGLRKGDDAGAKYNSDNPHHRGGG